MRRKRSLDFSKLKSLVWIFLLPFSLMNYHTKIKKNEKTAVSLLRAFSYPRYFSIASVAAYKMETIWLDVIF